MLQESNIDIFGRPLAYSILMNLDNSFEVGIVERSPLVAYICVFTVIYSQRCELFLLIYLAGCPEPINRIS